MFGKTQNLCICKKKYVFCKSTKYMCYYNDTKYMCFALTQNICVLQKYKIDLSGKTQDMCVQHTVMATLPPMFGRETNRETKALTDKGSHSLTNFSMIDG